MPPNGSISNITGSYFVYPASNPPTSPERRACETTSHQPAAASQQQAASCSQPAKPAKPASQCCIRASKPQASRHRCLQTLNIGASNRSPQAGTGRHSPPQVATGCQTFWHPQHQGGSQTCHKPIKYRRYGQLPSKSCGGGSWDDHFSDLRYPPKFHRVQDAGSIGGSSI